jgi:hypothetical protein
MPSMEHKMRRNSKARSAVSVVQVPGGSYPYFAVKKYTAKKRKSDGVVTWRAGAYLAGDFRSEAKAIAEAKAEARRLRIPYLPNLRHGTKVAGYDRDSEERAGQRRLERARAARRRRSRGGNW